MKKISLAKYAKIKKMPRALVIKKILSGELKAEEKIENGKKVRYILMEDENQKSRSGQSASIIETIACFDLDGQKLVLDRNMTLYRVEKENYIEVPRCK